MRSLCATWFHAADIASEIPEYLWGVIEKRLFGANSSAEDFGLTKFARVEARHFS
jgi:hypothetical protein